MKNNVFVISVFVVIVLFIFLFYSFLSYSNISKQFNVLDVMQDNKSMQNNKNIQNNKKSFNELVDLENELAKVTETNGEISKKRYIELEKILVNAEKQGYHQKKINYLRSILSNLAANSFLNSQTNKFDENLMIINDINVSKNNKDDLIIWHFNGVDWMPSRIPPECPNSMILQMPVDINLVTSVFYPGQVRGGNYKTHGGFRLDDSNNNLEVRAPFDGFLWRANRYIQSGEIQYTIEVIYPCGIMYMLDHLQALPPKLMNVISKLPKATENSLPNSIIPLPVTKGELLAIGVGMQNNVFIDFGVYDLRQKNTNGFDPYAVCGFNMLSLSDRKKIQSLPASDDDAGKKSDYC